MPAWVGQLTILAISWLHLNIILHRIASVYSFPQMNNKEMFNHTEFEAQIDFGLYVAVNGRYVG